MSSLKSYFRKKHKYETQAQLKDMTAEQIVNIDPRDVGSYIETETGGIPLTGVKRKAMYRLLAIKKQDKLTPNPTARQNSIREFLEREGIRENPEVTKLLIETDNQIMSDRVSQKQLENRLRKLSDQPQIPYTEDEELHMRLQNLKIAGRRSRRVGRRSRGRRTKRSRRASRRSRRKNRL